MKLKCTKCNYNVLHVRGEEHRNLESQYGSETSGAVNGGDKNVCSRRSSQFWSLRSSPPLLTKPVLLQTLLSLFATGSLRLSPLLLLDTLLLTTSSVPFPPHTEPLAGLSPSVQLIQVLSVFRVLFYAKLSLSSLLSVVSDVMHIMVVASFPGSLGGGEKRAW